VVRLLVTADIVPTSPILVTLMMEAVCSSEMLVLTRGTWHHIAEGGMLRSHLHDDLRSYLLSTVEILSVFTVVYIFYCVTH
jgi:hypothetical protein